MAFDKSFDTGVSNSNREQLLDITTVLAPRQAPVYGMLPKQAAKSDLVEWTLDKLADANANNAVLEGVDITSFDQQFGSIARLDNRLQHFRETFNVSKKQEVIDSVTPVRLQEAEEKATSQLLRHIEASICSDNSGTAGSATVAGKMRGLGAWIQHDGVTNQWNGSANVDTELGGNGITDHTGTDFATPVSSILQTSATATKDLVAPRGNLTESAFNGILTSIFEESGEMQDLTLVAGTGVRNTIIEEFTRVGTGNTATNVKTQFNQDDGEEVNYNVEFFRGPFGTVSIVSANPKCLDSGSAYFLDASALAYAEALDVGSTMLEDAGGGPRGYVDAMGTLICKAPHALGKIVTANTIDGNQAVDAS